MSMFTTVDELVEEEAEPVEWTGRSIHRTEPKYPSQAPGGGSWADYFTALKAQRDDTEEAEDEFTLLETGLPLGVLPPTQKRIWADAEAAGFHMQGYESRVWFADKIQKEDGKVKANGTQVLAGDVVKPAYEARNIFLGGHVPNTALRFHASWLDGKFRGFIWDPVGQYRYANSREKDERETYWVIRGSVEFEVWLDEWREKLTGDSRRLEKERAAQRKADREAAKASKTKEAA